MQQPIYLDNHASTPIDPRVLEAMMPFLTTEFGNAAAATHGYGCRAKTAVEKARNQIAHLIGADPQEIIFTSGATESNNAVLKGFLNQSHLQILTSAIEHSSVLDTCRALQKRGTTVIFMMPDKEGIIQPTRLEEMICEQTQLISIMGANNEIGTIQDIKSMAALAYAKNIIFHSDLTQIVGRIPVDVHQQKIALASLSAHKIYGPKGIGALYVRQDLQEKMEPLLHGGKHERSLRSGTLNVPAIVGFGAACALMENEMEAENQRILQLRNRLFHHLQNALHCIKVNGSLQKRLAGNLNVSFEAIDGEDFFFAIQPQIAISRGSACSAQTESMSHVLSSLGLSEELAKATIRFGIGRFNTEQEIDDAANIVIEAVKRLAK